MLRPRIQHILEAIQRIRFASIALILSCALLFPALAQVDPDTRRKLLQDFEAKNRIHKEQQAKAKAPAPSNASSTQGLEQLRQDLAEARLALLSDRSQEAKQRVSQATLDYTGALIRLEQLHEAASVLKTSIEAGAESEDLERLLIGLYLQQSNTAFERDQLEDSQSLLNRAFQEARRARLADVEQDCASRIRDLLAAWANLSFHQGDLATAKEKGEEAIGWNLDPEPIHALLAKACYLEDDYEGAISHLKGALRGSQWNSPYLRQFGEFIERERNVERDFRKQDLKGLRVLIQSGFAFNADGFERAIAEAREAAQGMFGLMTPLPVRLSVYQRVDYFPLCGAPRWSAVVSLWGKLRLRNDALHAQYPNLKVIVRYAYGLWLVDILTNGMAPTWFAEGVAHQLAYPEGPPNGGMGEIKQRLTKGTVLPFSQLEPSFLQVPEQIDAAVVMAQSQWAIRFLVDKCGLDVIRRLTDGFASAASTEEALHQAAGFSYDAFFSEWEKSAEEGFVTNPQPDLATLHSLGMVSPMASYWEK